METIKRKDFELMTFQKKLVLPFSPRVYYSPFYYVLIGAITILVLFIKSYRDGMMPLIWGILIIAIIALYGIWRRDQNRNFKTIKIPLKRKRFKYVLTQVGNSLDWEMSTVKQDYIIVYSVCPKYSWKRRITILRTKDELLVNMICVPKLRPLLGRGGIEREYAEILEKNIRKITDRDMSETLENLLN